MEEVMMLSTIHEPQMKHTEKNNSRIQKPISVLDYNLNSRIVDKVDMQLSFAECLRKSVKWYRKLFSHMLDLSVFNSYLIYKMNTGKKIKFLDYRLQLIREIFQTYSVPKPKIGRPSLTNQPTRFSAKTFIRLLYLKQQIGQILRKSVLYVYTPVEDLQKGLILATCVKIVMWVFVLLAVSSNIILFLHF